MRSGSHSAALRRRTVQKGEDSAWPSPPRAPRARRAPWSPSRDDGVAGAGAKPADGAGISHAGHGRRCRGRRAGDVCALVSPRRGRARGHRQSGRMAHARRESHLPRHARHGASAPRALRRGVASRAAARDLGVRGIRRGRPAREAHPRRLREHRAAGGPRVAHARRARRIRAARCLRTAVRRDRRDGRALAGRLPSAGLAGAAAHPGAARGRGLPRDARRARAGVRRRPARWAISPR